MAGFGDHKKFQKKIKKNLKYNNFKEQIIQNALNFHADGLDYSHSIVPAKKNEDINGFSRII